MAAATPRRSTRAQGGPRKRYTNDAFTASGLEASASDSSAERSGDQTSSGGSRDGDFTSGLAADGELEDEDDIGSLSDDDASRASDPDAYSPNELSGSDLVDGPSLRSPLTPRKQHRDRELPSHHSRGLLQFNRVSAKDVYHENIIGNDLDEISAYNATKIKFFSDVTVPYRSYADNPRAGLAHTFYVSQEERQSRALQDWQWYTHDGGREKLRKNQELITLQTPEISAYEPVSKHSQNVVLGQYPQQRLKSIPVSKLVNIDGAYPSSSTEDGSRPTRASADRGWLLNLGRAIHAVAWVPGQDKSLQYMSACTWHEDQTPSRHPGVSALEPWPPGCSTLQIWSFAALGGDDKPASLDASVQPNLAQVLCFDWGIIKRFEWCPVLGDVGLAKQPEHIPRLLAIIHGDGKVRIFDVPIAEHENKTVEHIKVNSVCFESSATDTVFTCLAWLSPSMLAAGCANGYVAIWDIRKHILEDKKNFNALPFFYEPLHETYISQIFSCEPTVPHMIITTGYDGHVRVCDIRDPHADIAQTIRHRVGNQVITWHPHLSHILVGDEVVVAVSTRKVHTSTVAIVQPPAPTYCIATSPVHSSTLVGCHDGTVVICNPLRKCTATRNRLAGYMQHWVQHEWRRPRQDETNGLKRKDNTPHPNPDPPVSTNKSKPLKKKKVQTNTKETQPDSQSAQDSQTQEQEEPSVRDPSEPSSPEVQRDQALDPELPTEKTPTPDNPAQGLTRIVLGFGIQNIKTTEPAEGQAPPRAITSRRKVKQAVVRTEPLDRTTTIYEEKSGVRCIAWNPNIRCGGWAAVGWGDGLLLVGDLCWE